MKEFDALIKVVSTLRKKCPWDKVQTHKSLKPFMIEETYEAIEAIDAGDHELLCEELGDMLLHVLMHAEMARESKKFTIKDVINGICAKMIRRHPHVFKSKKDHKGIGVNEVLALWREIKKHEK